MQWFHGGDRNAFEETGGSVPLDFSANTSPLGTPEGVKMAARAAIESADLYPDPFCRKLRRALSGPLGVPAEWILCGNGASDLILRLAALRPGRALLPAPCFSEYEAALRRTECRIDFYRLQAENNFRMQWDILERITEETDLMILCEPNNPSGVTTDPALLAAVLERCRVTRTLLAVDECFLDFLERPEEHTLLSKMEEYRDHLLILRAFTKFYGMAGLRLGYLICGSGMLRAELEGAGMPWAVSGVAQEAGVAALRETEYALRLRRLVTEQREWLFRELSDCGFRVIPGEANFLLFYAADPSLAEKLMRRGIWIRTCEDFRGLAAGWYRVAVRTERENRQLAQACREEGRRAVWQSVL